MKDKGRDLEKMGRAFRLHDRSDICARQGKEGAMGGKSLALQCNSKKGKCQVTGNSWGLNTHQRVLCIIEVSMDLYTHCAQSCTGRVCGTCGLSTNGAVDLGDLSNIFSCLSWAWNKVL